MGPRTVRLLRLIAVATVIAMVPLAIMLIPMTDLPDKKLRQVALSYNLTTSINESSTTVGIADSDLYGMSQADIVATFDQMQSLGVNTVRVLVPWGDVYKVPPGDPLEALLPSRLVQSRFHRQPGRNAQHVGARGGERHTVLGRTER